MVQNELVWFRLEKPRWIMPNRQRLLIFPPGPLSPAYEHKKKKPFGIISISAIKRNARTWVSRPIPLVQWTMITWLTFGYPRDPAMGTAYLEFCSIKTPWLQPAFEDFTEKLPSSSKYFKLSFIFYFIIQNLLTRVSRQGTHYSQFESSHPALSNTYPSQPDFCIVGIVMNIINETVFLKPKAQDDRGLEEEAESLLVRTLGFLRVFYRSLLPW